MLHIWGLQMFTSTIGPNSTVDLMCHDHALNSQLICTGIGWNRTDIGLHYAVETGLVNIASIRIDILKISAVTDRYCENIDHSGHISKKKKKREERKRKREK